MSVINGKGSSRRPRQVSRGEYGANYERTFGRGKMNGATMVAGPRVVWWACYVCGHVTKWHESSGEPRRCEQCRAEPNCYEREHENGVYTVTSIGGTDAKWEVTKEEDHD